MSVFSIENTLQWSMKGRLSWAAAVSQPITEGLAISLWLYYYANTISV